MNLPKLSRYVTWPRLGAACLTALWLASVSAGAQTIENPSFEADSFGTAPGYISVNAPITGWTASDNARAGLNPAGGQSPFANNGVIPDGTQVAFIQSANPGPVNLSTLMSGLTPGETYKVNFRVNGRNGQSPILHIGVDGQSVLRFQIPSVGGTAPYRYAAFDFTASAETHTLYLTNDTAGDSTLLLDAFTIAPSTSGWSYANWSNDATMDVDSARNYTHAYNLGVGDPYTVNTVINGVTFTARTGAHPGLSSEFGVANMASTFGGPDDNVITQAGGGSAPLMSQFIYGGNPGIVTIGNLVPGQEYVATLYSVGWEDGVRGYTVAVGDDRLTVNQDQYGNNQGIRISYRYTAPANGQISLIITPFASGTTMHLYGFSNYEVTTPDSPVIGVQPRDLAGSIGVPAVFSATASGTPPLSFQWQHNGVDIPGATSRLLTLNEVAIEDLGVYTVTVSNGNGSTTSDPAALTVGQIPNPSFEADSFLVWPGYISGNSLISGWIADDPARVGINPLPAFPGPFANNGTIPDGEQVALIQSVAGVPHGMGTLITGLTPGEKYTLSFFANARAGQVPVMHTSIDGEAALDFRLGPATVSTDPYKYVAFDFTPAGSESILIITNNANADTTALVDNFQIAPSTTLWTATQWSDDASSGVDGTKPYTHAFSFGSGANTIINGVTFQGAGGVNPAVAGSFSTTGFPNSFANDTSTVTGNGGGGAVLARDFIYGGAPQTITIENLVPGSQYLFTVYSVGFDPREYGRAATFMVGDDRLTINQDMFGNDAGILISYPYTADESGTFTLSYYATHNASGPSTIHTYGFSNYEVASTTAPVFYKHPVGRTVSSGVDVTFTTIVGGEAPITLQWQKDGVDLPGETGQTLTLTGVDGADTGEYTLVASNGQGTTTSNPALLEVGLNMVNPSFEVDAFTVFPGYIGGNAPITGWEASIPAQTGLNPTTDGQSPFANSGAIPDGNQVAFIQADGGALSQVVSGMTVGNTYYIKFFENARAGYNAPTLEVTLGGETVVPAHVVNPGQYALVVSGPFQATAESATLSFIKTPGPAGGDSTVVIDSVAVLDLPPSPPEFLVQPVSAYLAEGNSFTFTSQALGTLPISYQWQKDSVDIPGATGPTLDFPSLLLSDAGTYTVTVENQYGTLTSDPAVLQVGLPIPELFNTGVNDDGSLVDAASVDPHYTITSSADAAWPGPDAVVFYDAWPIPPYLLNGPDSKWISARMNAQDGNTTAADLAVGLYTFRTQFILDTLDPDTAVITGLWAMDNDGVDILINGVSTGNTASGFEVPTAFTIDSGFVPGLNTLDFIVENVVAIGPMALRVQMTGVAMPLAAGELQITVQPEDQLVSEGGNAQFSVVATGGGPISYQWYFQSPLIPDEWFDMAGEVSRTLRLNGVAKEQEGSYRVVVTNPSLSVTSEVAVLTVNLRPIAGDDTIATATDQPVAVPVAKLLANDSDPEGDDVTLVGVSPLSSLGGTVVLAGGQVTYTPPAGYQGDDVFTYTIRDSVGGTATGNVIVIVGWTDFTTISTPAAVEPDGTFRVGFTGVPNYLYTIERATDVEGPWEFFQEIRADAFGVFEIVDPNNPPEPVRFYRTEYP